MITQKTIAKELGISRSLVSRALAGTASNIGASEETVRKIRDAAKKMGYMPNAAAQALRGAKSGMIGVIIKDFDDPFLGRMTGAIQELACKNECSLILTGFASLKNRPLEATSLLRHRPDALLICGSDICSSWVDDFAKSGISVVQIGSDINYPGVFRVETDEKAGLKLLLDYIMKQGHRKIAFIGMESGPHLRRRRLLEEVMRQKKLNPENLLVCTVVDSKNTGLSAMTRLLDKSRNDLPDVIIAADDITAQGALRAIYNAGLSVPGDISLTGFDDIPAAELMIPALTTIRVPVTQMVDTAFERIFAKRRGKVILMKSELVERESCAPPTSTENKKH